MAAEPEISGKPRNTSLLKYILPIDIDFEFENRLMPTEFSKSLFWRSLYIVGPSQIQRLGLLFQGALTCASLGKQITFVAKKRLNRFPPTVHSLPKVLPENMANISFKYCEESKQLEELLISYHHLPTDLLPDVLIVSSLNEYVPQETEFYDYHVSQLISLLAETSEYLGRRKKSSTLLYVTADLAVNEGSQDFKWPEMLKQWSHEVWVLHGNSNRLISGIYKIQFKVLGSNIFLNTISDISCT